MGTRTRPLVAGLAALIALVAFSDGASAAVTIGSNLPGASGTGTSPGGCNSICTGVNVQLPATAPNGLTSPINGVVVRWRVKTSSTGNNPVSLRIMRQGTGTNFTALRTSEQQSLNSTTVNAQEIAEFPTRLPIAQGDSVGLNPGNSALVWFATGGATSFTWSVSNGFNNGLPDNTSGPGQPESLELRVQAVVEPDADNDGFGDETQDGCPADPTRQAPPCSTGPVNPGGNPGNATNLPPVISSLTKVPLTSRIGQRSTISFRLSEAARYTLLFEQRRPGRMRTVKGVRRCVLQTKRVHTGPRCPNYTTRGRLVRQVAAGGTTRFVFFGTLNGRALPVGTYRLTATALDSQGAAATPRRLFFTLRPKLVRRHR